jgi:hypothetical protein
MNYSSYQHERFELDAARTQHGGFHPFQFHKRSQFFIGTHDETPSVARIVLESINGCGRGFRQ